MDELSRSSILRWPHWCDIVALDHIGQQSFCASIPKGLDHWSVPKGGPLGSSVSSSVVGRTLPSENLVALTLDIEGFVLHIFSETYCQHNSLCVCI